MKNIKSVYFFMGKIFLHISLLILGNLLAFCVLGLILDEVFGTENTMLLGCVFLSFPVFVFLMLKKTKKLLREISSSQKNINDKSSSR